MPVSAEQWTELRKKYPYLFPPGFTPETEQETEADIIGPPSAVAATAKEPIQTPSAKPPRNGKGLGALPEETRHRLLRKYGLPGAPPEKPEPGFLERLAKTIGERFPVEPVEEPGAAPPKPKPVPTGLPLLERFAAAISVPGLEYPSVPAEAEPGPLDRIIGAAVEGFRATAPEPLGRVGPPRQATMTGIREMFAEAKTPAKKVAVAAALPIGFALRGLEVGTQLIFAPFVAGFSAMEQALIELGMSPDDAGKTVRDFNAGLISIAATGTPTPRVRPAAQQVRASIEKNIADLTFRSRLQKMSFEELFDAAKAQGSSFSKVIEKLSPERAEAFKDYLRETYSIGKDRAELIRAERTGTPKTGAPLAIPERAGVEPTVAPPGPPAAPEQRVMAGTRPTAAPLEAPAVATPAAPEVSAAMAAALRRAELAQLSKSVSGLSDKALLTRLGLIEKAGDDQKASILRLEIERRQRKEPDVQPGVTEQDVMDRIEAIRKTTEDISSGKEGGRVVIYDPEAMAEGVKKPMGAISGGGKTLDLVAEMFDEVSAVADVPPGKLLEAIRKDKENPTFLRLKRAVASQMSREAEAGVPERLAPPPEEPVPFEIPPEEQEAAVSPAEEAYRGLARQHFAAGRFAPPLVGEEAYRDEYQKLTAERAQRPGVPDRPAEEPAPTPAAPAQDMATLREQIKARLKGGVKEPEEPFGEERLPFKPEEIKVRRDRTGRQKYIATLKGYGAYGWGDTPEAAKAKFIELFRRFEAERRAKQGIFPGTPSPEMPKGKLRPTVEQKEIEETPLFGQERAKAEREAQEAQQKLPGVAERAAPFFSSLQRVVEARMPVRANAQQVRGILKGGGVKTDEIKWVGVEDFLREKEGQPIEKRDLLDFLKRNEISVTEEILGGPKAPLAWEELSPTMWAARDTWAGGRVVVYQIIQEAAERYSLIRPATEGGRRGETRGIFRNLDAAKQLAEDDRKKLGEHIDRAPYERFVLPGGKGYRVMLLVLRDELTALRDKIKSLEGQMAIISARPAINFAEHPEWTQEWERLRAERNALKEEIELTESMPGQGRFQSAHFGVPNIIAHIRFNERIDTGNRTVLFIEEIQSDWHQQGHKQGYAKTFRDATKTEEARAGIYDAAMAQLSRRGRDYLTKSEWDAFERDLLAFVKGEIGWPSWLEGQPYNLNVQELPQFSGVAPAPFAKNWHEVALKRILRYAADHGFQMLAWTSGEQQAERYSLARVVDSIGWSKNKDGTVTLAFSRGAETLGGLHERLDPTQLRALVGQELSARIMAGEGSKWRAFAPEDLQAGDAVEAGSLRGLSLSIGGEALRAIYDRMIPQFLSHYAKRWGAKIGTARIPSSRAHYEVVTFRRAAELGFQRPSEGHLWAVLRIEGERPMPSMDVAGWFGPEESAQKFAGEQEVKGEFSVQTIDITPEMRHSVMTEGQALFERRKPYAKRKGAGPDAQRLARSAIGDLDRASNAVSALKGTLVSRRPRGARGGAGVRTLGLAVSPQLVRTGRVDLRGKVITTAEDIATLAQVYRDPRFETFRIIYIRGNEIVGHEGVTSRLPGETEVFVTRGPSEAQFPRAFFQMQRRMERLGADGYWLLHNHPSGRMEISKEDLAVTREFERRVPGFKGHVVIDSGAFGYIAPGANRPVVETMPATALRDPLLTPAVPLGLLGRPLNSHRDAADIGKALQTPRGFVTLIYRDQAGKVRAIQEIPEGLFTRGKEASEYIRARQSDFGSQLVVSFSRSEAGMGPAALRLIGEGVLKDHVEIVGEMPISFAGRGAMRIVREPERRGVRVGEDTLSTQLQAYGQFVLEQGNRDLAAWSEAMVRDLGEEVRPFLEGVFRSLTGGATLPGEVPSAQRPAKAAPPAAAPEPGPPGRRPGAEPGRPGGAVPPGGERVVVTRQEFTAPADVSRIPPDLARHLSPFQQQGVAKALDAMERQGGFLLADGTGTGKTRQQLAVAKYHLDQGRKVLVVAPAEALKIKKDYPTGSWADDATTMEINLGLWKPGRNLAVGAVNIATYHKFHEAPVDANTVLIFDEGHFLKNAERLRSQDAIRMMAQARAVLFSSATPADKPVHLVYLAKAGVFEGRPPEEVFGELGMIRADRRVKTRSGHEVVIKTWEISPAVGIKGVRQRMSALFDRLTDKGLMVKREISMAGVEVDFQVIRLPQEALETMERISEGFGGLERAKGLLKARILMHQRRQQEPFKIARAVAMTRSELEKGRQVVLFVSRVSHSEAARKIYRWTPMGRELVGKDVFAESEGTAKSLKAALREAGVTEIADLHGAADTSSQEAMEAFQSGKAKVLIATIESGGTGINLDDRIGNRPRTMIVVTAPFSAMENVQAAGRVWRLTTKSAPRLVYLFSQLDVDKWNASIIAGKMETLGATVRGEVERLAVTQEDLLVPEEPEVEGVGVEEEARLVGAPAASPRHPGWRPQTASARRQAEVKRSEILKLLSERLGVPIRVGKFRKRALGIFKVHPRVIRLKGAADVDTAFHEVGHFLQTKFASLFSVRKLRPFQAEVVGLAIPGGPPMREGFAEFVRYYGSEPGVLGSRAPNLLAYFEASLEQEMPEVLEVLRQARDDWALWQSQPARAKVRAQIHYDPARVRPGIKRTWDLVQTAALDKLHMIEVAEKELVEGLPEVPAEARPYLLARVMAGQDVGIPKLFLERGTVDYDTLQVVGEPLKAIIRDLEEYVRSVGAPDDQKLAREGRADVVLNDYLSAKRAIALHARGKRTGIDHEAAGEVVQQLSYLEPIRERLERYQDAVNLYVRKSYGMSEEQWRPIKAANPYYVPFYRAIEDELVQSLGIRPRKGFANQPQFFRRFKGSELEVLPPLDNIVRNTLAMAHLAHRNEVAKVLVELAEKKPGMGWLVERVPAQVKPTSFELERIRKALEEAGVDITEEVDLSVVATVFSPTFQPGRNEVSVWIGGKKRFFEIGDPWLRSSLLAMNRETVQWWLKVLSVPAKILRATATAFSFEFPYRNIVRDNWEAAILADFGFKPFVDFQKGLFEAIKAGHLYEAWLAGGGHRAMVVSMDRTRFQRVYEEMLEKGGPTSRAWRMAKNPLDAMQAISEASEMATRIGVFDRALRAIAKRDLGIPEEPATGEQALAMLRASGKGRSAVLEAGFASREGTIDFARMGLYTQGLSMISAFWNPGIQGLDRVRRRFRDDPKGTFRRAMAFVTVPTILLYLANRNDEEYYKLPWWRKDTGWNVKVGKTWLWIPRPWITGALFGSVPERTLEWIDGQNRDLLDTITNSITRSVDVLPVPTAIEPLVENWGNWHIFFGRPIVPRRVEDVLPELQAARGTSEVAKALGRILRYSPAKIENLILGWFASPGRVALESVDKALEMAGKRPPSASMTAADIPIVRAFVQRWPTTQAAPITEAFELIRGLEQVSRSLKLLEREGRGDELRDLAERRGEDAILYRVLLEAGRIDSLERLAKSLAQVHGATGLSPEQKRDRSDQIVLAMIREADAIMLTADTVRDVAKTNRQRKGEMGGAIREAAR